jgi:hypothetical protein
LSPALHRATDEADENNSPVRLTTTFRKCFDSVAQDDNAGNAPPQVQPLGTKPTAKQISATDAAVIEHFNELRAKYNRCPLHPNATGCVVDGSKHLMLQTAHFHQWARSIVCSAHR